MNCFLVLAPLIIFRRLALAALVLIAPAYLLASPVFNNISDDDLKQIVRDFSAVVNHTSVSPASSLGRIFGFEIGLVGGMTKTPEVDRISKDVDPNSSLSSLPHGGLLGRLTMPLGFSGEIVLLPSFKSDDIDVRNNSIAGMWTFSDLYSMPVDAAVKLSVTKSDFSFTQDFPVAGTKVEYDSAVTMLSGWVSRSFILVEPYAGFGLVRASAEVSSTDSIFTGSSLNQKASETGTMFALGANLNLIVFKAGLELSRVFGNDKYTGKISFYF